VTLVIRFFYGAGVLATGVLATGVAIDVAAASLVFVGLLSLLYACSLYYLC